MFALSDMMRVVLAQYVVTLIERFSVLQFLEQIPDSRRS